MIYRICILFFAAVLGLQTAAYAWTMDKPKVPFYEKAGWLDHLSNTMRRVAQRGEQGAYDYYKNNNPSPRNAYESVNIHQANLSDLGLYRNSSVYQQAQQMRKAFLSEVEEPSGENEAGTLSAVDLTQIRTALSELMSLYNAYGSYYPIVTQAVLEISRQMLPLQQQYALFAQQDLTTLKRLFRQILSSSAQCGQGEGYRLFCEGRADALDGMAVLAFSPQDAQLIAQVLQEDIQQPFIARELLTGTAALLNLKQEALLDPVLAKAVDKEGESFWQKIDVFMTGWWVDKVQYRNGRYLGNVSAMAVVPGLYGQADGNAWEEMARLLYNEGHPSAASLHLLAKYGLGSCQADMGDFQKGQPLSADGALYFVSARCQTLLPFLVGALSAGARHGADQKLTQAADKLNLSAASLTARLYFENVMGDLNAETELRLDNLLYGVFEKDFAVLEKRRLQAQEHNRKIDEQLSPLLQRRQELMYNPLENLKMAQGQSVPERWLVEEEIARLQKQKVLLPSLPDHSFKNYDRQSDTYQRKVTGQKIYQAVRQVSSAIDLGLGIYYTAALPGAAIKGVQWGMSLKRGVDAVRAGRVTADARRLASLSARLKKIRTLQTQTVQNVKAQLSKTLSSIRQNQKPGSQGPVLQVSVVGAAPVAPKAAAAVAAPEKAVPVLSRVSASSVPVAKEMRAPASAAVQAVPAAPSLRQVRLTAQTTAQKANLSAASVEGLRPAALETLKQALQMQKQWKGSAADWVEKMKHDPLQMENAFKQAARYAELEKDLAFYQAAREAAQLPADKALASLSKTDFLFSSTGRTFLAEEYVSLLQTKIAALGQGSDPFKASLYKKLYAAVKLADDMADPALLVWPENGIPSLGAMRARVKELRSSGTLSTPMQQQEAAQIWKELQTLSFSPKQQDIPYLLRLRILNLPFLQKAPNTIWSVGDGFSGYELFVRKTPLGFPLNQMITAQPFDEVAKFFQKGKENILIINGHGYVSQNGQWKGILRQARPGETRPASTISAEKIIQGALQADSPRTSVYVHSCQTGALFNDLPALFEKYPQAARKTDWFTFSAPLQPASARTLPASVSGTTTRERLLNKLLLNMTDNGAGLAARAWVDGRDLYPLRASVKRLEREIAAAPADKAASLQALQDDLQMLLNIADASDQSELVRALEMFSARYPQYVENADRVVFADSFGLGGGGEFLWGFESFSSDIAMNMAPFLRLEKRWVDYVADTAREMFDLFKTPSSKQYVAPSKNPLRLSASAQKDLEYAAAQWPKIEKLQQENAANWRAQLLADMTVRDMGPSLDQARQVMSAVQKKWQEKGIVSAKEIEDPLVMRQVLEDMVQYAQIEKQINKAQRIYDMYNLQAGVEAWKPAVSTERTPLFDKFSRKLLAEKYFIYLKEWRRTQPAAMRPAADRAVARSLKLADDLLPEEAKLWNEEILSAPAVLRQRLIDLGAGKKNFSALQQKEYNSLARALYQYKYFSGSTSLELQSRLVSLPYLEKTPNTIFVWGDGLSADQAWARKTLLGFYRPRFAQFMPLENMRNLFKKGEENVLLMHVRGGVNRNKHWKAIMMDGDPTPNITISADDFLRELPKTGSKHNSVYINGCFSGTLLDNLMCANKYKTLSNTDWFVTSAPMQHSVKEYLPADIVSGTVREKLFGKMLQRIEHNGDGVGGRALVDGKEIYPLQESLRALDKEIAAAPLERQKSLTALRQDLQMLYNISQSRTSSALLENLRVMQKAYPSQVLNMNKWRPNSPKLLAQAASLPPERVGPDGFFWGLQAPKLFLEDYTPFVLLKQSWVDYVASTARKMFAQVPKYAKDTRPSFAPEAFKPTFSSPTAKYIFEHRTVKPFGGRVEESFFRVPVQIKPAQEVSWKGTKSILRQKEKLQQDYLDMISEFEGIKKDVNTSFYYAKNRLASLDMMERRALRDRMLDLRSKMLFFQKKNLQDKALQGAVDWLDNAVETLLPLQRGRVLEAPVFARPDRTYTHKEFFLRDPDGTAYKTTKKFASFEQKDKWLQAKRASLPKNLRVAVLNDDGLIVANYQGWLKKGNIGENAQWSFYRGIDDFMKELYSGKEFDLILTDLNFPDGGARYVVSWMRQNGNTHTAIIASSSFPDNVVDGAKLLAEGFDGYLSTRHLSLARGEENLLRALNNYFKYRDKNGWVR